MNADSMMIWFAVRLVPGLWLALALGSTGFLLYNLGTFDEARRGRSDHSDWFVKVGLIMIAVGIVIVAVLAWSKFFLVAGALS